MKYKICRIGILLLISAPALAYDPGTHVAFSRTAYQSSIVSGDPSVLINFGFDPAKSYMNSQGDRHLIPDLIQDGARFEDDGFRAINHFYDPLRNRPLSVPLLSTRTSPDWALEDTGVVDKQAFSYRDARGYFGRYSP